MAALFSLVEHLTQRTLQARGVTSRWVETSVARQHLYDAPGSGSLPTIVVLHGISSSASAYAPLIQRLRREFRRVIAPDAPGHGHSRDPRVPLNPETLFTCMAELLDEHIDEPVVVFGCSLGGAVAVHYALSRPARVRGLMLASPAGAAMKADELDRLLKRFDLTSRADAKDFLERLFYRQPWYTPLITSELVKHFARPAIASFRSSLRSDHLFTAEQLASLSMPVHLVWGRADRVMPESNLAFYRKCLPRHAVIEEPERMGHCPHLDDPATLAKMIAAFAQRANGESVATKD